MKYIKTYETFETLYDPNKYYDVKVGDYVIVIKQYRTSESSFPVKIKNGERCKVISLEPPRMAGSQNYVIIENENGIREDYRKNRIIPEFLYNLNKYNL